MKINLKSTKQTAKTFTMTFEFENEFELKKLQALSILFGNYNPMRQQMKSTKQVLDILNQFEEESDLEYMANLIANLLK